MVKSAAQFELHPAIRLQNGRTIATLAQAIAFVREHEMRPGVDDRDEVLHALERARTDEEREGAVARFRRWLAAWGVTLPVTTRPGSTTGVAE